MSRSLTRRSFIKGTAAIGLATIVPRSVLGGPGDKAPSSKLNVAGIGIGGMGHGNIRNCRSENITALCDVDHAYVDRVFKQYPNAKRYKDYREMLATHKDIDAIVIATPDHTHAVISAAAMLLGIFIVLRVRWPLAALLTVTIVPAIYHVFATQLGVPLPWGWFGW